MGVLCGCLVWAAMAHASAADRLVVGAFSAGDRNGWAVKTFSGTTAYALTEAGDRTVLSAQSRNSASGLVKKIRVDLRKYPYLNWRWRIENRLGIENERVRSGDDYAARIYVVIDGGIWLWRTRAMTYVWAHGAAKGSVWENAFAGKNAMMMAVRNRQDAVSTWYTEKRNVAADLERLFGTAYDFIDAVALMTDTDNSHGQVRAYYGDIYFSAQ